MDTAREIARGWHGDLARRIDPKDQIKDDRIKDQQSISFEEYFEIFRQKYILEKHKPSTIDRDKNRIKKYILPFFRNKKIGEIIQGDILAFVDSMKHAKGNCNKCLILLSTSFSQAEKWSFREKNTNPCKGVEKFPDKKMERFLTDQELKKLEDSLTFWATSSKSSPYTLAAIWMLLYIGAREGEVLSLKWEDVHLDDGYLYLKDSKVGVRTIPLNNKAKQVLKSLPQQEGSPYVFCGRKPGKPLSKIETTWHKVRKLAGIPDVRIHDLRHSFASFALKKGVDLYTVSKLLGHKNIATTTRYAHLELDHLKKATNKVAEIFS